MTEPYRFITKEADGQSLVHLINLHLGNEIVGAELGVFRAVTFCTLLQNCPSIKMLYGIDAYVPYTDYLKHPYDGTPAYSIDAKQIEYIRLTACHNIEFSGCCDRATIVQEDSSVAVNRFPDGYFDFIFVDTYMTYEQAAKDLKDWYPKLKKGGLFSGHDYMTSPIQRAVGEFRDKNKVTSKMSVFDSTWAWIKE